VSVTQICADVNVPKRYTELIIAIILNKGWVASCRGAKGGYKMCTNPKDITLLDILNHIEGSTRFISCLKKPELCEKSSGCLSRAVLLNIDKLFDNAAKNITLSDLKDIDDPSEINKFFPRLD